MQRVTNIVRPWINRLTDIVPTFVALGLAIAVSAIMLFALEANPIEAFSAMWDGAFGTENAFAETIVKAIPIAFVAIGITVAFRGGVINIGGEGQMIVGALAGTAVTLALGDSIGWLVIPLALFAGFMAGGLYGGLAGFLKAYFDVNEILSTIMLNQVAVQLMNYLLNGPLLDPESAGFNNIPKTARITEVAQIPRFMLSVGDVSIFDRTRLHWGIIIVIVVSIVIYIVMWRTVVGFRIRAVGYNERASTYAGISVKRQMTLSMFLAGGLAGVAGIVQVLGLQYRLQTDGSPAGFTASAGFNGIVAALFGGLHPIGAVPASVLFGGLLVGAQKMQREIGVPASIITAINGVILVFVVSSQIFIQRRALYRSKREMAELAKEKKAATQETVGELS